MNDAIGPPQHAIEPPVARRPPVLTALVLSLTAACTSLQFVFPGVLPLFERSPAAYQEGEWWRWFIALVVHDDGWPQIVCNFLGLVVAGAWVEQRFTRGQWLAFYLCGGMCGQVAGVYWQPHGAGASVALCGWLGAMLAWLALCGRRLPWRVRMWGILGVVGAAVLCAFRDIHGPPVLVATAAAAILIRRSPYRAGRTQSLNR